MFRQSADRRGFFRSETLLKWVHMEATPKKAKILLAEDEPLLGNLLKQRLEREGLEVNLVRDGEAALAALRANAPDLMLLDIILPKMSGFELMEAVQSDPSAPKVPIVIISNLGQDSDLEKGQSLGAVGYFIKAKISMEDLVGQIKGFVEGQ